MKRIKFMECKQCDVFVKNKDGYKYITGVGIPYKEMN